MGLIHLCCATEGRGPCCSELDVAESIRDQLRLKSTMVVQPGVELTLNDAEDVSAISIHALISRKSELTHSSVHA